MANAWDGELIVDTHQHLWDPDTGWYSWLDREPDVIRRRFVFDDALADMDALSITGTVLVQSADRDEDTDAMLAEAAVNPRVLGVVGYVPLEQPDQAGDRLQRLRQDPAFVGVRNLIHDQPDPDWLLRRDVADGLRLLEENRIPFDLVAVLPRHLEHVTYLSETFPSLTIVIDHLGKPPVGPGRTDQRRLWRGLIRRAAENPRVVAKISGLYRSGGSPTVSEEDLRPWVEDALSLFGPHRLMIGSDWPICVVAGEYGAVTGSVLRTVRRVGDDAFTRAVLGTTAARIYALTMPAGIGSTHATDAEAPT